MAEVNLAKRKEKCENCTKQCNKRKTEDDTNSQHSNNDGAGSGEQVVSSPPPLLLSACLSCEGCLTEEETVKISQQSLDQLLTVLALNQKCDVTKHRVLVASLCPQSLPFFAVKFGLDMNEAAQKLCGFLKSLGVQFVFDTTVAAGFSVLESQREFVQRYRRRSHDGHALPMFTSSCPGWIRYAERVLGGLVTPHICTARSPQQIMGRLIKDYFSKQQKLAPGQLFHVVVAPCFDKKLEAVREEFYNSVLESRDVDCVLTSAQLFGLMEEKKKTSVEELDSTPLDHILGEGADSELLRLEGRGSEGFLEHIFKHAAKELFGLEVGEVTYRALRNRDFQEVSLERDGETLLQFAAVYGFRNIQTLVHRMKNGRLPYQLVEVLSCPGGCLSGRGQAESEDGRVDKALVQQMEEVYTSLPVRLPELNPAVLTLYQDWIQGQDCPQSNALLLLHTEYRTSDRPHPPPPPPHMQW